MTGILIQALQFFASLSMLVLIHEFGHYITARMVGARVDKFYLFFNPWFSLYKRKIGGTEYGIGWLPLGGYVSLYDSREIFMDEESEATKQKEELEKQLKRARRRGNSMDVVRLEAEVETLSKKIEELKDRQRTMEPVKDELRAKKPWQRLIVMIAGVVMNVIFAIGIYSAMLYTWGEQYIHNDDMVNGYIFNEEAEALGFRDGDRIVTIDGEKQIEAETLIVATGASAKYLGLESEAKFRGMGVSACATCDGFFYRKQDVAVVGGGDTACEEATYLASICKQVYLIVRKPFLRASKAMQERVFNTPNIKVMFEYNTVEVLGDEDGVTGALLRHSSGEETTIDISGFFLAIGHHPNTDLFKGKLELDAEGYIKTIPGTSKTNIEGVFAAGDVKDPHYRQAITAAGSGCIAALDCERYLLSK